MTADSPVGVERFIDVFGRRVRVRVHGEGRPILLVNGLGANVSMWAPLLKELDGFRVISFDAPGTGCSPAPFLPYKLSMIADVAARVLDELGEHTVDVLGYSLGGGVAQTFARRYPDRVRRMVIVSSSCGAGAVPGSLVALTAVMTPARHYLKSGYRMAMKMVDLAPAEKLSPAIKAQADNWHHETPPTVRGYALQMMAFFLFNSLPWLSEIEQPVLVLTGSHDRLIPMANAAVLAAYLPRARMRVFEDWGHYLLHDGSSGAGGLIAEFLRAEDHEDTDAWGGAQVVGDAELAESLATAPPSAHPSKYTGAAVRRRFPILTEAE